MRERTDPHRPGAIIPAEYEYVFSYNLSSSQNGWPVPSLGVNCELDRRYWSKDENGKEVLHNGQHNENGFCCILGLLYVAKVKFADHGNTGKCTVCGAEFIYGDIWKHVPTGEYIHIGHICANKYSLLTDRSAWELELNRRKEAAATQIIKVRNQEEREAFLAAHPGLEVALQTNHHIVQDIASRFATYRTLSEKQVALVMKLYTESITPKAPEAEAGPAPSGRQTVVGIVVGMKEVEDVFARRSYYNSNPTIWKMLVKLENNSKVWTTAPRNCGIVKGEKIQLTATFEISRNDPHFAFGKRPVVKIIEEKENENTL